MDDLQEIEHALSASDVQAGVVTQLRTRFPHLSWTTCDASDLTEAPFRSYARFDLHLLDRSDHCVAITSDPARATGLVVAARSTTS